MKSGRKFNSVVPQLLVQGSDHQSRSKVALGEEVCIDCALDEHSRTNALLFHPREGTVLSDS